MSTCWNAKAIEVPGSIARRYGSEHRKALEDYTKVGVRHCSSSMRAKVVVYSLGACTDAPTLTMRERALTDDAYLMSA
jgi:hypothetical protein